MSFQLHVQWVVKGFPKVVQRFFTVFNSFQGCSMASQGISRVFTEVSKGSSVCYSVGFKGCSMCVQGFSRAVPQLFKGFLGFFKGGPRVFQLFVCQWLSRVSQRLLTLCFVVQGLSRGSQGFLGPFHGFPFYLSKDTTGLFG